jgi:hypothetical protein
MFIIIDVDLSSNAPSESSASTGTHSDSAADSTEQSGKSEADPTSLSGIHGAGPPVARFAETVIPTANILAYLGVDAAPPALHLLDSLLDAYARRVPWESATRIVKRSIMTHDKDCPRWPREFWQDAARYHTGGTCFESNYAFFTLLRDLGFHGYLTINDMGATIGCHTAIVILLDGARYLVDAGMPLYAAIPLDYRATQRDTRLHTYTATPQGQHRYSIDRDRHPRPNCFTLVDVPVSEAAYRAALTADYGAGGLFLDRVIINRVIDGRPWRFASDALPYQMETFHTDGKTYYFVGDDLEQAAIRVAAHFEINADIFLRAMQAVTVSAPTI